MDLKLKKLYRHKHKHVDDDNIRKCLAISDALEKNRNWFSVASILENDYFQCLSEDYKAQVFRDFDYTCANRKYTHDSPLYTIIDRDNPSFIQQILPYMPLHAFQSCSLPPGLPWIESKEWMRNMLVKHKIRWNLNSYDVDSVHKAKENVQETLQKLSNLAFTMMAAELFDMCSNSKSILCCRYLLTIAPKLVEIKVSSDRGNTVALCRALIKDRPDVIQLLQEQQAPIEIIAQAVYLICDASRNGKDLFHHTKADLVSFIANTLKCTKDKDEIRLFRDKHGNTLLHLLFSPLFQRNARPGVNQFNAVTQYLESCIQTILDYGVDPRVMNVGNETALDVLFGEYAQCLHVESDDLTEIFWRHLESADLTEIFLRNLERILPSWGIALPSDFPRQCKTSRDQVVMMRKIAELISKMR